MRRQAAEIIFIGMMFLALGTLWSAVIYQRCAYKEPPSQPVAMAARLEPPPKIVQQVQRTVKRAKRSAYAKGYHIAAFWAVAVLEAACAGCFVLTGLFLLIRSLWTLNTVIVAMAMDLTFKSGTLAYMYFFAVPLAKLIGRKNILVSYYRPNETVWSTLSAYFSGLAVFEPGGWLVLMVYVLLWVAVVFYLFRPSVRVLFRSQ